MNQSSGSGRLWRAGIGVVALAASATASAGEARAVAEDVVNIAGTTLELSAAVRVREGVLVADDEQVGAVLFLERDALERDALERGGSALRASLVKIDRARKDSAPNTELPRLFAVQDIEGLAASADGDTVYIVGSHAPTAGKGQRRTDREFLIKARWRPDEPDLRVKRAKKRAVPGIYRRLIDDLAGVEGLDIGSGFNVEGLALRDDVLYIGLRAPLSRGTSGNALILSAPEGALFGKDSLDFDGPFGRLELDLGGGGVRGLHWDPPSAKLLVISGPSGDDGGAPRALWSHDPETGQTVLEYSFSDALLSQHGNPEGITRIDDDRLLVVFDTDEATRASLVLLRWRPGPGP